MLRFLRDIKWITDGVSRDCLLIGDYAIKIASFRNGWFYFINGIISNYTEASHYHVSGHPQLAQHYYLFPLGIISVYKRYRKMWIAPLSKQQLNNLPIYNPDARESNYAQGDSGEIVVLDYGHCDCYIKWTKEEWLSL